MNQHKIDFTAMRISAERVCFPETTIQNVLPKLNKIGLKEITLLESNWHGLFCGIVEWSTRPSRRPMLFCGKGTSADDAKAGALMECIERLSVHTFNGKKIFASYKKLKKDALTLDPQSLTAPKLVSNIEEVSTEWVQGIDIRTKEPTYVPLNAVLCPYIPTKGQEILLSSTNGLASGNTRLEAVSHALCEVIERDSIALKMTDTLVRNRLNNIKIQLGLPISCPVYRFSKVAVHSLPNEIKSIIQPFCSNGNVLDIINLSLVSGVATFEINLCTSHGNVFTGSGTHPSARIALIRALTEMAQTQLLFTHNYLQGEAMKHLFMPSEELDSINFEEIHSYESPFIEDDIVYMLERLAVLGLQQVIEVDVTHEEYQVPVSRIIIPHSETWPTYMIHTSKAEMGKRSLGVLTDLD